MIFLSNCCTLSFHFRFDPSFDVALQCKGQVHFENKNATASDPERFEFDGKSLTEEKVFFHTPLTFYHSLTTNRSNTETIVPGPFFFLLFAIILSVVRVR